MAQAIQHILEAVGFTPRESRLYILGLQIGSAPASEYAKRTKLNRITVYNTLEKLAQQGYFTFNRKARAKWYAPVEPEHLAVEVRKNAEGLERSLPELRSLMGATHRRPRVRFFEGMTGVKKIYEDTLSAESEILNFANSGVVRSVWPEYDDQYVAERVARGIRLRGIAPDDAVGKEVQGTDKQSRREIRLVDRKQFDFTNEINVYDDKVAIVTFADDESSVFGVIIESPEVAKTQRQIFEMAWRYAG